MDRCVLVRAGRCRSLEDGNELPPLRPHPFLRDAQWCGACADRYLAPRVTIDDREMEQWPQDADGAGSLCVLCGCTGRTLLCCDGPCGGYFATCEGCAVRLMGLDEGAVRAGMADDAASFHCVFCRAGAAAALNEGAYDWMRKHRSFLPSARSRSTQMLAAARAAPAAPVLVPWLPEPAVPPPPPQDAVAAGSGGGGDGERPAAAPAGPVKKRKNAAATAAAAKAPAATAAAAAAAAAPDAPAPAKAAAAVKKEESLSRVEGAAVPAEVTLRGGARARVVRAGSAFAFPDKDGPKRLSGRLAAGVTPADFSIVVGARDGALHWILYVPDADVQREPERGLVSAVRRAHPAAAKAVYEFDDSGSTRRATALPPALESETEPAEEDGEEAGGGGSGGGGAKKSRKRALATAAEADELGSGDAKSKPRKRRARLNGDGGTVAERAAALARAAAALARDMEEAASKSVISTTATHAEVVAAFAAYVREDARVPDEARAELAAKF